ncbi:LAQU0S02e08416g1_1 [Lachancea quebecensis]|uniref:LAQU0S02e08416g1_1 n=1 Tax=Lachancea quebecensis TaxID=1654605 RepID=A0A0P1KNZ4_9SACH|nr:LAQU0S02e08416g1_1 [Lachancea quebecensis]
MDRSVYEACSDLVEQYGRKVGADEILSQKVNNQVPIPFKSREDLELAALDDKQEGIYSGELAPRIDLKVLHYYATQLIVQKYPHLINCFDETALVTFGLLVEKWVEDYLRAEGSELHANPARVIAKKTDYRKSPSDI